MKVMKPIASHDIPADKNQFLYEIKYDGFRAILIWEHNKIEILSKRNVDLTNNFPEIITFCAQVQHTITPFLPLILDGELVVLNNEHEANFSHIQTRGRLKNKTKIKQIAKNRPATFLAFDIIKKTGRELFKQTFVQRKKALKLVMDTILQNYDQYVLQMVPAHKKIESLRHIMSETRAEGMIAKRMNSKYEHGKQHHDWFKIKNWRTIRCFLTFFNPGNGYFTATVFQNGEMIQIGKCKHGLPGEELQTLKTLFINHGEQIHDGYRLPPAICAEIHTLDMNDRELREPEFVQLLPNSLATDCTYDQLRFDLAMMPQSVSYSNLDKLFWPHNSLRKIDLLIYLRLIYPYMQPFLHNRVLTVIRCPDGVEEEFFYQKSLPNYAPQFMKDIHNEAIICNNSAALIWLANHGAIEYHVAFQTIETKDPVEIVFDLDPPNHEKFHLAVKAALLIKRLIDNLDLISFVKTSGSKGLQIHIPLPPGKMTYNDTAIFTEAIATTLVQEHPQLFTIERLKKNRHNRLYIDYVQHGKGKTIIAPYSPRKTKSGTVATPLFWHELTEELTPNVFTIQNVVDRVQTLGCPFAHYEEIGQKQNIDKLLQLIRD